ncbi:hypothetical protein BDV10DRAFT_197739 [Aspergillus recurvatus]
MPYSTAITPPNPIALSTYLLFSLVLIPLILGILLIFSDARNWHLPGDMYTLVGRYRTSVQTAVQIIASVLAVIEIFALCTLINRTTRIWFTRAPVSLNTLGFWSALSTPTFSWSLPFRMMIITFLFSNLSAVIAALWTGALTPANTTGVQDTAILVPDWSNLSYIREYPSEIDRTGPTVRNRKGFFTYSVGVAMSGSLLSSVNSASPVDGSARNHGKLDNTGYSYHGRSYGVGASVGLVDDSLHIIPQATNYTYEETGLDASVTCIHNTSSLFVLDQLYETNLFAAHGPLPDSIPSKPEYSVYLGRGNDSIVAIGVAAQPIAFTATRYMAIAAGGYYADLNTAQCAVTFTPARFNVSVDMTGRNITVGKLAVLGSSTSTSVGITNIDPNHNMTHIVMRQMELIANGLTGYYRSTLGDALNASISDYRTSTTNTNTTHQLPESQIVLKGLENALISLIDDMLVAYASAQLIVGGLTAPTPAQVQISALRVGSRGYIITSAVLAGIVAILVVAEATRMRWWRELPGFDYLDNRVVVVTASRGGKGIANHIEQVAGEENRGKVSVVWKGGKGGGGGNEGEIILGRDTEMLLH